CDIQCKNNSLNCSTAGNEIFLYHNGKLCYISDISAGPMDESASLVGNDFTNENEKVLISRIRQRKYQVNGWLYCSTGKKSQNYVKESKIRLENLEGQNYNNILCRKRDYGKFGIPISDKFSSNPITHATVTSVNQMDSGIVDGKVKLVNNVNYLDENDKPVFKCEEAVSYKVYFGENSWTSC
ncbi:hypothetical protein U3516DRAFT_513998, partial [Neocallimastix sp. 'constans']